MKSCEVKDYMWKLKREIKSPFELLPQHLAIIMDGNGRWAKARMLGKSAGHKAGAETLRRISKEVEKLGIKHLTVYAFSTENWSRDKEEVDALMSLLSYYLQEFIDDSKNNDTKVDFIGDPKRLPAENQQKMIELVELTKNKSGSNLHLAINYGGRDEIVRAVKNISSDVAEGWLKPEQITDKVFSGYLDTKKIPDPDLLIRTSGELRISNFLLWQLAYTEMYFSDKLWPDFDKQELYKALTAFQKRDRRFGIRPKSEKRK